MKVKFLLFLSAFLITVMLLPENALSQKKYYILFDNFEDEQPIMIVDGMQNPPADLFNIHYWNPLRNDFGLGKYAERKPFSAATFAAKDITEYDIAIFVMGTKYHLGTSVDGIKVIDKINQMLAANKSVIIVGYQVLAGAYAGGDVASKNFLENWLGISNPRQFNHVIDGTIYGMKVKGIDSDPIAAGYPKWCNMMFNEGGDGTEPPYRYYPSSPFFEVQGGKNAVGFDVITEVAGVTLEGDPLFTGARAEQGNAKVAFWSINYDITNSVHRSRFYDAMLRAMRWMLQNVPHPEGFLRMESEALDFGSVEPNLTKTLQAVFMNTGRETLTVSKFEIAGDEEAGVFEIVEGGEGIVMNPGDIRFVDVKFAPKDKKIYEDYLIAYSNGVNGDIEAKLIGQGGDEAFFGPRLEVTRLPVNFGTLPYAQVMDKNIPLTNTGNLSMVVHSIKMIEDADKRFKFVETISTPFNVPPGETYNLKVRFTSSDEEAADFKGKIEISTSALNNGGSAIIELIARAAGNEFDSGLLFSTSSLDFGAIELGESNEQTLKISNIGNTNVRVFDVKWDNKSGGENLEQFSFVDNTDKLKPTLAPGEAYELKVKFEPRDEKDYLAQFFIVTNDPANELVNFPVSGKGKNTSSVKDQIASTNGLTVSIKPSPITDFGTVEYSVEIPGNLVINVVDQTGRKVLEFVDTYANQGNYSKELSSSELSSGMYFLSVSYNGKQLQVPFLISK